MSFTIVVCAMALSFNDGKVADMQPTIAEWQYGLLGDIKKCMAENSFDFRLTRIAEEFSASGFANAEIRRSFLNLYVQGMDHKRLHLMYRVPQFTDAVAAAGAEGVDDILALVFTRDDRISNDARARLLFGLGRMDRRGKSAIPRLAGEFERLQERLKNEVSLSLILANIGDDSESVRKMLILELTKNYRLALTARAVRPTCEFSAEFNRELKNAYADALSVRDSPPNGKKYTECADTVLTLICLNGFTKAHLENIEKLLKSSVNDGHFTALCFWSALSRALPERRKEFTLELLKGYPAIFARYEKSHGAIMHYGAYDMVNAQTATILAEFLFAQDNVVADAAASMMEWSGAKSRGTVPELLKSLRAYPNNP